ncbi:hypothetical protein DRA42_09590 [Ethanoligenens harbinense]|nr:hypothetical protein CXQ68_09560 [Ethanoligenens harbinense YUAN-3]AYF39107.1 hypothetical protein CXP51_09430 [Ethanoligenens harbinense]AYF41934.1 hypothetical protein CN246_10000 [Ethanoligenens harbinense]QCN92690.1 hypothetical protein DRA42_09590 [Ethanoligenens harbinense]
MPETVADFETAVRGRAVFMGAGAYQLVRLVSLHIGKQVPFFGAGNLFLVNAGQLALLLTFKLLYTECRA